MPVDERVAVFDSDGTLWFEKPMPIQLDFILLTWVGRVPVDVAVRQRSRAEPVREQRDADRRHDGEQQGALVRKRSAADGERARGHAPLAQAANTRGGTRLAEWGASVNRSGGDTPDSPP